MIRTNDRPIVNGKLIQIGAAFRVRETGRRYRWWAVFSCQCGEVLPMRIEGVHLRKVESCGCGRIEATTTHGDSRTRNPTYVSWRSMKLRCSSPNDPGWKNYGGRGISVCERWWSSYPSFLEDMGARPHGTTLDRKNTEGNYEPSNCRWATDIEQHRNRRDNTVIEYNGQSLCVAEWSEKVGIRYYVLLSRINAGWDIARALGTPVEKRTKLEGT